MVCSFSSIFLLYINISRDVYSSSLELDKIVLHELIGEPSTSSKVEALNSHNPDIKYDLLPRFWESGATIKFTPHAEKLN
jgi:hypothetical protein